MGGARHGLLFIAGGVALYFLLVCLAEADLLLVPCRLDPRTKAWLIPFPIVQNDGSVHLVRPNWDNSYDNLRAVVQDNGYVEIVKDAGTTAFDNPTVVLAPELAANYDNISFINLTSYDFHWWARGNLKIYNTDDGKKKIDLYLTSISRLHKKYLGKYEFVDNKIILSTYSCKRFLFGTSIGIGLISIFLIFLGFILMLSDIISKRRAKRQRLVNNAI